MNEIVKLEIDNVRFSEAMYLRGAMSMNLKQGVYNSIIKSTDSGIWIEIPADEKARAPQFTTLIPWAKVKQVEFKA